MLFNLLTYFNLWSELLARFRKIYEGDCTLLSAATNRRKFLLDILVLFSYRKGSFVSGKFTYEIPSQVTTTTNKSKAVLAGFVIIFQYVHALIMSRNSDFVRILLYFRCTDYILHIYAQIYYIANETAVSKCVAIYTGIYCIYEFSMPLSL